MNNDNNEQNNNNKRTLISIAIILIIIILLLLRSCDSQTSEKTAENDHINENMVIDQNAIDKDKLKENKKEETDNSVTVFGFSQIKMSENCRKVEINYYNPEQNADKYYLKVSIELKETGEILYESDLIPPGQAIKYAEFSKELSSGTYDATIHVQPYKMNDFTTTNNADLDIKIIVE